MATVVEINEMKHSQAWNVQYVFKPETQPRHGNSARIKDTGSRDKSYTNEGLEYIWCVRLCKVCTFSISETEVKETPSKTSGAVKALKSCWVTYSSVNEMLPEGMSRRDQGEMMKPMAAGSGGGKQINQLSEKRSRTKTGKQIKQLTGLPLFKFLATVSHTQAVTQCHGDVLCFKAPYLHQI